MLLKLWGPLQSFNWFRLKKFSKFSLKNKLVNYLNSVPWVAFNRCLYYLISLNQLNTYL